MRWPSCARDCETLVGFLRQLSFCAGRAEFFGKPPCKPQACGPKRGEPIAVFIQPKLTARWKGATIKNTVRASIARQRGHEVVWAPGILRLIPELLRAVAVPGQITIGNA